MTALPTAQFAHGERQGDVTYYERRALEMRTGEIPYHDFFFEYPPGSLPVLLLPTYSPLTYGLSFRIEQWLLAAMLLVLTCASLTRIGATATRVLAAAVFVGLTPLLLGSVMFNRFDLWPATLVSLAVMLLLRDRPSAGLAVFGLATATKIYPIAGALIALVWLARRGGWRATRRPALAFAAGGGAVTLPFALVGFGGLGFSLYQQLTRGLEIESLGGSALFAVQRLGLHRSTVVGALSFDYGGALAHALATTQGLLLVAVLATIVAATFRHPEPDLEVLTTGVAAAVTAVMVFGRVLSPQYLMWLVPIVPIVARAIWVPATIALGSALVLTHLWFPEHFGEIVTMSGSWGWLVVGRNAALLTLLVLLVARLLDAGRARKRYPRDQMENPPTAPRR